MLPAVVAYAEGLVPVLDDTPTHELGLRLAAAAVDAHAMAGNLAFQAGDVLLTHRHLAQASQVAEASGDPLLRARAWAMLAKYVYSPLPNGRGSARLAVSYLGKARALARHADGYTRAWLLASLAEQAAEPADVKLCQWAVHAAGRALDTATGHAGGFFSPQGRYGDVAVYLHGVYGRVAGLSGRLSAPAAPELRRGRAGAERPSTH